ncbi:MAG: NAD(P)/FAD-dependent oxidoreductase [Runella sp.]
MRKELQIVVVGGGAAGFMGAITAAETFPNAHVILLEKSRHLLNKVKISGGGRCNVTNAAATVSELVKGYPRGGKWLRPLLEIFSNQHTIEWFGKRGVILKTEPDGRMFPTTNTSATIVDCLIQAARKAGVEIRTSTGVVQIKGQKEDFELSSYSGEILHADRVLITTGGYPQLESYDWIAEQGIEIIQPVPSLFTFNAPQSPFHALAGVSVSHAAVKLTNSKLTETGPLLFTHWGVSGPAVLRLSAWGARELAQKKYEFTALVNFVNQKPQPLTEQLQQMQRDTFWRNKYVISQAPFGLPQRLWQLVVSQSHIPDTMRWTDLPAKNLNRLVENLSNWPLGVQGKTTFKEEFVTCGGVSLHDIHAPTLESKVVSGLFFAGEVLDIDGITGGYNFQAAWTTGYIAGKHLGA